MSKNSILLITDLMGCFDVVKRIFNNAINPFLFWVWCAKKRKEIPFLIVVCGVVLKGIGKLRSEEEQVVLFSDLDPSIQVVDLLPYLGTGHN